MPSETLALLGGRPAVGDLPGVVWPVYSEGDVCAVADLVARGSLSTRARDGAIASLEDRLLDYFGAEFSLSTSSGTAALHSAYVGIGLEPGDEVLAPTYTYFAAVMPAFLCSAVPVLVDADPETANLRPEALERRLSDRTRAVVVTHNAGVPADMTAIMSFARTHGLSVIEDCSHAHGAKCDGRLVGTIGTVGAFSLQNSKLVPAGEGGFLLTSSRDVYERATLLGHPRERACDEVETDAYREFCETGWGLKYRIHPLAAVLAKRKLDELDETIAQRRRALGRLSRCLLESGFIEPPVRPRYATRSVPYSYRPLYRPEALEGVAIDTVVKALEAEGVPVDRPAARPLHEMAVFKKRAPFKSFGFAREMPCYEQNEFEGCISYDRRVLRFPSYRHIDDQTLESFTDALEKVKRNAGALVRYERSTIAN